MKTSDYDLEKTLSQLRFKGPAPDLRKRVIENATHEWNKRHRTVIIRFHAHSFRTLIRCACAILGLLFLNAVVGMIDDILTIRELAGNGGVCAVLSPDESEMAALYVESGLDFTQRIRVARQFRKSRTDKPIFLGMFLERNRAVKELLS